MSRMKEKLHMKKAARLLGVTLDPAELSEMDLDVFGDGQSKMQQAAAGISALAEAGKGIGDIVQQQQQARDAADKSRRIDDARRALVDAKAAMAKADVVEKDPNGPVHLEAKKVLIDAQASLDKLVSGELSMLTSSADKGGGKKSKTSGVPTWVWWAAGTLGVVVVGAVGYSLIKGKKKR